MNARASASRTRRVPLTLFAFGVSGAAALAYEVVWTRELSLVFGSTTYGVATMLAAFMTGLALGGLLGGRWADRGVDGATAFAGLELYIGVFGLFSVVVIEWLPGLYYSVMNSLRPPFMLFMLLQSVLSFLVVLVPTTLMGATFPVVTRLLTKRVEQLGREVGDAYAANTVGAVVGSLAAGFLLVPALGSRGAIVVAATLNIGVAVLLLAIARRLPSRRALGAGLASLLAMSLLVAGTPRHPVVIGFHRLGTGADYQGLAEFARRSRILYEKESAYSRVVVIEEPAGGLSLQNGGLIEGSNYDVDRQTTSLLALLPYRTAATAPESALVVGLGTGYTSTALLDAGLDSVTTVEINPAVVPASEFFIGAQPFEDPRWLLEIQDARNYLELDEEAYDVITSEPSWPVSGSVAHLFTLEFFELAREHLNEGGAFCQWVPRYLLEREDFMMMYRTFSRVFPNNYVWAQDTGEEGSASDLMFVGVRSDMQPNADEIKDEVASDLARAGVGSARFGVFDAPETLAESLSSADVPLNTDDRPRLEFRVVRNRIRWLGLRPDAPSGGSKP